MLRKQMLANAPREQHREIIQKFKEDRMRKFADLGLQYDQSINDLLQKQKVGFLGVREEDQLVLLCKTVCQLNHMRSLSKEFASRVLVGYLVFPQQP